MKSDFFCKVIKEIPWSIIIALGVLVLLLSLWRLDPCCFEKLLFGSEKIRKIEVLTFIGAIVGGIILIGRLFENSRRNDISEKASIDIRFKDAAILLSSEDSSSIIAGIFALQQITKDSKSQDYVNTIKDILCATIRTGKKETFIKQIILVGLLNPKSPKIKLVEDDLRNADLTGVDIRVPNFLKNKSLKIDFTYAELCKIKFINAKLIGVDFTYAKLSDINFTKATLRNPVFNKAELKSVDFTAATLSDVNFTKATLCGSVFKGATINNTKLPEGDKYLSLFEEAKNSLGAKEMTPEVLFEMVNKVKLGESGKWTNG